jgi:hypothetical protein
MFLNWIFTVHPTQDGGFAPDGFGQTRNEWMTCAMLSLAEKYDWMTISTSSIQNCPYYAFLAEQIGVTGS